jgi:diketogulonate reductase-like aldo/keto reductase
VILRWLTQREVVVIPKSVHKEEIIEKLNIFNFELSQEDMEKIATLDTIGRDSSIKKIAFFRYRAILWNKE